jgi:hypothetical protein
MCICEGKCREEYCSNRSKPFVLDRATEIGQNVIHDTVAHDRSEPLDLDRTVERGLNSGNGSYSTQIQRTRPIFAILDFGPCPVVGDSDTTPCSIQNV